MRKFRGLKRIAAVVMASSLMVCALPGYSIAVEENTAKEEVVYINLNYDGSVSEINVVNIFQLDADGHIVDYGKYDSLRNMTSTDAITYTSDLISVNASKGKLYYEGKLTSNEIPWDIDIHYYMDGKEYTATDIAGMSGQLKLTIDISKNEAYTGGFYEGFALQASVTLDTGKCTNIAADGATVANVGSDKQLTYTILPGKGANIEITADVTDFEMDGIAINGVKLKLDIDIDDSQIQDKINEIVDAVGTLDEGANKLNEGSNQLYEGTTLLDEKVGELYTGVGALTDGTKELAGGLSTVTSMSDELVAGAYTAFQGVCTSASATLNASLTALGMEPVTLTPENYELVLTQIIQMMGEHPAAASVTELKGQLDNYSLFYEGVVSYTTAVGEATQGANLLSTNMDTLYSSVGQLDVSVGELNTGVKELVDGMAELKSGTGEFKDAVSGMDTQVSDEIDSMVSSISGDDVELTSFVSDKNINIESVQFVIKTNAIEKAKVVEAEPVVAEKLNFWQKLLRLFGLY